MVANHGKQFENTNDPMVPGPNCWGRNQPTTFLFASSGCDSSPPYVSSLRYTGTNVTRPKQIAVGLLLLTC